MKILNIHGYHGSAHNSAASELEKLGLQVISPAIDYDTKKPEEILQMLRKIIAENMPDVIVGTSLGGFYGAVLSAQDDMPVFLVSPCLMPFLHLPRLGYKGDVSLFMPLFWKLSELKSSNVCTIVGDSDEVIDTHQATKAMLKNARYREIPGGRHSGATLPLSDFFREMLEYIGSEKRRAERRTEVFCSGVNRQLADRFRNGTLFQKGNVLTRTNSNGNHQITVY